MLVRHKWILNRAQTAAGLVGKQEVKRVRHRFSLCSLVLVAGLGMAMLSETVRALGLGDIEVRSALNQPLDAEISLLSVKADDASRINVKLADDIAYLTSGIERTASLSQLTFTVGTGAGGKTVIKVVSQDPVKEPFLDFIIEINWPSGRLLREYTILLDPPVFAGESSAAITAPATARGGAAATKPPASSSIVTPGAGAVASPTTGQGGASLAASAKRAPAQTTGSRAGEYTVKQSESLRSIADSINPSSNDLSSEQVMMAMYRLNPDAFFDDNINNLKKGYVLRTPDETQVAELSRSDAAKQARDHYERWLQRRKVKNAAAPDKVGSEAGLAAMGDGAKPSARKQSKLDAQLRLLSPEEGDSLGVGGQAKTKGTGAAADKEVIELENRELKDQISSLKEQLATMERLITLKTDAMVELQKKVGTDTKAPSSSSGTTPTESSSETTAVTPTPPVQTATEAPAQVPAASQPAKKVRDQKAQPETVESSWMDALMEPRLLAMLVGVVLLLGAGVWMFLRRRREANELEFEMPFDQEQMAPVEIKLPAGGRRGAQAPAVAESSLDTGLDFGNAAGYQSSGLETFETDESEIDPIAEADVYLAYRRFQQAEDLIRDALKREPQREELHLKMLEIYFGSGNKEGFEAQAEALYAILGGAETDTWHKVVSMGQELCPDHPLFGGGAEPVVAAPAQSSSAPRATGALVTAADQYAPLWQQDPSASTAMVEIPEENHPLVAIDDSAGKSARAVSDDHVMDFSPAATKAGSLTKSGRDERVAESTSTTRENTMDFDLSGFPFDKSANNGGHDDVVSQDSIGEFDFGKLSQDHESVDAGRSVTGNAMGKRERSEHDIDAALQGLAQDHNLGEGEEVFTGLDDVGLGNDGDDDLFSGADMVSTKLDLARAYIDMDDREGARGILNEVLEEGNSSQKQEATELMRKLG